MRIRTIKPDFWTDAKVSKLTYLARLLFIGLWNVADDEGRFKSDPRILKGSVFPVDDKTTVEKITGALSELSVSRLVFLTEIGGEQYGCCPNFKKHQKINRPSPSRLPPVTAPSVSPHGVLTESSRTEVEVEVEKEVEKDSGLFDNQPAPSSPSAAGCDDSGKKTEGNGKLSERDLQIVAHCYEFYPRHEKPNAAHKAILKALKDPQLKKLGALNGRSPIDELWMRVQEYAVYVEEHKGEFTSNGRSMIPYPASWFNAGSYLVDPTTKRNMLLEK
jgi:hypothetical protein